MEPCLLYMTWVVSFTVWTCLFTPEHVACIWRCKGMFVLTERVVCIFWRDVANISVSLFFVAIIQMRFAKTQLRGIPSSIVCRTSRQHGIGYSLFCISSQWRKRRCSGTAWHLAVATFLRLEGHRALTVEIVVFWDVTPCSSLKTYYWKTWENYTSL